MINEKRAEHNARARQEARESHIANVNFHSTNSRMVGAGLDIIDGFEHVELRVGKATFFMDGRDSTAKVMEMQLIGLAIVAASEELLRNGPS